MFNFLTDPAATGGMGGTLIMLVAMVISLRLNCFDVKPRRFPL